MTTKRRGSQTIKSARPVETASMRVQKHLDAAYAAFLKEYGAFGHDSYTFVDFVVTHLLGTDILLRDGNGTVRGGLVDFYRARLRAHGAL
jgi:hypothetical protein